MKVKGAASPDCGFTLVELAIVMTIIGLLVGGVLVGKDLIEAAELRSMVSEVNKLQTAYTHFRGKYKCRAGDCSQTTKFLEDAYWTLENGDGNHLISCGESPPTASCPAPTNEHVMAMISLHLAGFIAKLSENSPESTPTKLRDCHLVIYQILSSWGELYGKRSTNYIWAVSNLTLAPWRDDCMTPEEAYAVDSKMDDGYASTGWVLGKQYQGGDHTQCASVPFTGGVQPYGAYNLGNDVVECSLFFRMD